MGIDNALTAQKKKIPHLQFAVIERMQRKARVVKNITLTTELNSSGAVGVKSRKMYSLTAGIDDESISRPMRSTFSGAYLDNLRHGKNKLFKRRPSIHIPQIPPVLRQLLHPSLRRLRRHAAFGSNDFGERMIDVRRHALGIAANIEMRAFV